MRWLLLIGFSSLLVKRFRRRDEVGRRLREVEMQLVRLLRASLSAHHHPRWQLDEVGRGLSEAETQQVGYTTMPTAHELSLLLLPMESLWGCSWAQWPGA